VSTIGNRKTAWRHLTLSGNHFPYDRGASAMLPAQHAAYILREATMNEDIAKRLALGMAILCVRNTCIWNEYDCNEGNNHVAIGKENYFLSGDGYLMPARKGQRPPDLRYFGQSHE
jgi:hypothetical protein